MSSRAIYDSTGEYRARTHEMARSPGDTFLCGKCGRGCSILGRRLLARDGRRTSYICKRCQEEAKA